MVERIREDLPTPMSMDGKASSTRAMGAPPKTKMGSEPVAWAGVLEPYGWRNGRAHGWKEAAWLPETRYSNLPKPRTPSTILPLDRPINAGASRLGKDEAKPTGRQSTDEGPSDVVSLHILLNQL